MSKYERYAVVNTSTGEVVTEVLKAKNEELKVTTNKSLTDKQKQFLENRRIVEALHKIEVDAMKGIGKYYEGFVWLYYVKNKLLLDNTGLEYADIARVLYLGTYLSYNKKEENMLVVRRNQRVIEPMTREDMMNILGLKERAFKTFLKNAKDSNILVEDKKKFYLSKEYFAKGEVNKKNDYTRLYVAPIKNLFEGVENAREHKSIGMVMSLIPFLNYDWNYLENADGTYMTLSQMSILLGKDVTHASRLFKQIRNTKISYGGKEHDLIAQVVLNEASDEKEERIYINPMICYRGKSPEYHHEVVKNMLFKKVNTKAKSKKTA